jgi:hypothetical protein
MSEETVFKDVPVSRSQVLAALKNFDELHPDENTHESWLENDKYVYAISHGGRLYPPKHILSEVTGIAIQEFSGGEQTNRIFQQLGFTIIDKPPTGASPITEFSLSPAQIEAFEQFIGRSRVGHWSGFRSPVFEEYEVHYKQAAVETAYELLKQADLENLLNQGKGQEIIDRIREVAQSGDNLLFLSVPTSGDIGVLFDENLDKEAFCRAFIDLLYGSASSPDRLDVFSDFLESHDLPNKWAFATYYLYLRYPQTEIFVKPRTISWLLKFLGIRQKGLPSKPTGELYATIREVHRAIGNGIAARHPKDETYHMRNMVDIQSAVWLAYVGSQKKLAAPFSEIFADWNEAEWAFDLMQSAAQQLGIEQADERRAAFTFRRQAGQYLIRLNYGNWLIFGLAGGKGQLDSFRVALLQNDLTLKPLLEQAFSQDPKEPPVTLHKISADDFRDHEPEIWAAYEKSLAYIKHHFSHWYGSPFHHASNPRIAQAVLDPATREKLLSNGLESIEEASAEDEAIEIKEEAASHFGPRTFELLRELHESPTKAVYDAHKPNFKAHVEKPFQALLHEIAVGDDLRSEIIDKMETDKRIFGRILKNDFGQGGAWDFYWGAFYPRDSTRTSAPQLFGWLNHECLEIGFTLGEYDKTFGDRFRANCQAHTDALLPWIEELFANTELAIADRDGSEDVLYIPARQQVDSWREWLHDPDIAKTRIVLPISRERLLKMSTVQLVDLVASTFNQLFPFVLLAVSDNPVAEINNYLEINIKPQTQQVYSLQQCAEETGIPLENLMRWKNAINRKKQAIFYGPPGTGKTYLAERLARHLIGGTDGFCELIQFHPGYAYEDFMQGIRPRANASGGLHYPMEPGRFMRFCKEALERQSICVLIIDEINRANLSRVLGELMYLLEYRDRSIPLAMGDSFKIPVNVRIIGTMNTADRSIALVDHALRRRFAFLALYPDYNILQKYHARHQTGFDVGPLIQILEDLNRQIGEAHYSIGPSYFLVEDLETHIADIWQLEIEPYLEEYFFDQPEKYGQYRWDVIAEQILP